MDFIDKAALLIHVDIRCLANGYPQLFTSIKTGAGLGRKPGNNDLAEGTVGKEPTVLYWLCKMPIKVNVSPENFVQPVVMKR